MAEAAGEEVAPLQTKELTYSNGATYKGTVNAQNQRHGKGFLTFPNGEATYDG